MILLILAWLVCLLFGAYLSGKLVDSDDSKIACVLGLIFAPPIVVVALLALACWKYGEKR